MGNRDGVQGIEELLSMNLTPYSLQEFPVFFESQVFVVFLPDIVRRRSDHQMDAVVRQFVHRFG
uniref:Uncharacterized protein n=1 Tax=Candidatus Methanogaster sp. ANME-2c ERB4 TaxID=2759911 RepID=A0A7G9YIM3_9EURY|nr:hypothetical protein DJFEGNLO_00011 [Methanosarcinales archaeon ANME-2c ERB4]